MLSGFGCGDRLLDVQKNRRCYIDRVYLIGEHFAPNPHTSV